MSEGTFVKPAGVGAIFSRRNGNEKTACALHRRFSYTVRLMPGRVLHLYACTSLQIGGQSPIGAVRAAE